MVQLYLPASRVFSLTQAIPFHVMFCSSALSLAAFMPYGPTATILAPNKQFTRLRVLRQSTVDVRYGGFSRLRPYCACDAEASPV